VVAHGHVVVERGRGGLPRLRSLRTAPPLGVRIAGGELHLLGTAMGPLGGDDLTLEVDVAPGLDVTVRSVAASVVLPGDGQPSRQSLVVRVGAGARVRWLPEPVVAAAGCDHTSTSRVELRGDAELVWRDVLVLGRTGEDPGRLVQTLRITRDDAALVHQGLDTGRALLASPAVLGPARATGLVVRAGAGAGDVGPLADVAGARVAAASLAPDLHVTTVVAGGVTSLLRATAPWVAQRAAGPGRRR
jgi:urease accessory protein